MDVTLKQAPIYQVTKAANQVQTPTKLPIIPITEPYRTEPPNTDRNPTLVRVAFYQIH